MKVITCASFMGSGSSAISDLVAEYDSVQGMTDFEFRFLHDTDGISDLEFHLCQCHNRHNSGHALKRFVRLAKFNEGNFMSRRYSQFFGKEEYRRLTKEYVDALTDFTYTGWWFYDLYDKGPRMYYFVQLFNHLFAKLRIPKQIPSKEITYCAHPTEEKFLKCTQDYVSKLLHVANPEGKEYLTIDQIVPSQNIGRILRYFSDETFVIVVDRDPRDVYMLLKHHWNDYSSLASNVEDFCNWFRYVHEAGSKEDLDENHVMRVRFEDIIYRYDQTQKQIESFLGLSSENHVHKFEKMNPKRSVYNTQVWKKHQDDADIAIIEERLKEYLYPFDEVAENEIVGKEVTEKTSF